MYGRMLLYVVYMDLGQIGEFVVYRLSEPVRVYIVYQLSGENTAVRCLCALCMYVV